MFNRKRIAALEQRIESLDMYVRERFETRVANEKTLCLRLGKLEVDNRDTLPNSDVTRKTQWEAVTLILDHLKLALRRKDPFERSFELVSTEKPDVKGP